MYRQYFKQAWNLICQERLFSLIYIIGTGLAISMVMVLSIVFYLKIANIYPETNRDRMLVVKNGAISYKGQDRTSSGSLSLSVIQTCFGNLEGMEALAITFEDYNNDSFIQPPGGQEQIPIVTRFVNRDYWTVFPFRFLEGQPFTEVDMQSGIPAVVLCRSLAHRLFGKEEVVGKYVSLNFRQCRVCGVVQDVSQITEQTYGQIWMPYTACSGYTAVSAWDDTGIMGRFQACILAEKVSGLSAIKAEAEANVNRFSQTLDGMEFSVHGQPDQQWQTLFREWSNATPNYGKELLKWGIIFLVLLLVPAVSLSGMADSRMERRLAEMGVRRAFGAPALSLMKQVFAENFLFTLLGGIVGLLFSYLVVFLCRSWIMQIVNNGFVDIVSDEDVLLSPSMLMNFQIFGIALGVCFLLNLLSALIPAWQASHREIVYSLNAK